MFSTGFAKTAAAVPGAAVSRAAAPKAPAAAASIAPKAPRAAASTPTPAPSMPSTNQGMAASLPARSQLNPPAQPKVQQPRPQPQPQMPTQPQQNQSYKIQRGDTLSGLAKRNNTTVDALAKANNIKDVNKIYAGRSLNIPGMPQQGGPQAAAKPKAPNQVVAKSPTPAPARTPMPVPQAPTYAHSRVGGINRTFSPPTAAPSRQEFLAMQNQQNFQNQQAQQVQQPAPQQSRPPLMGTKEYNPQRLSQLKQMGVAVNPDGSFKYPSGKNPSMLNRIADYNVRNPQTRAQPASSNNQE